MLDGLLFARYVDGGSGQRSAEGGVVEKESAAGILAVSEGRRVRDRAREFLPVAGRDGGLDAVPRQSGIGSGMRRPAVAAGAAVQVEADGTPDFGRPFGVGSGDGGAIGEREAVVESPIDRPV